LDRFDPKRETPQARSQNRLQASGIGCASIDGAEKEISKTQRCRRNIAYRPGEFGNWDATADSLW
jgi:hypothetical protein